MSKSLGIPVKLLHEAEGHIVTVELKSGEVYRGSLIECEDNWNSQLESITYTAKAGIVSLMRQKPGAIKIPYANYVYEALLRLSFSGWKRLDGKVSQLEHVFIRGSKVRYMIIPDMLKNAPMFKRLDAKIKGKGSSGVGVGRGRASAMQAKARSAARGTVPPPMGGRGAAPPMRR